jgi:hypothetical protein
VFLYVVYALKIQFHRISKNDIVRVIFDKRTKSLHDLFHHPEHLSLELVFNVLNDLFSLTAFNVKFTTIIIIISIEQEPSTADLYML